MHTLLLDHDNIEFPRVTVRHLIETWIDSAPVLEGENPPVGLILCAERDSAVAHYTLENLPNKVLAAEYRNVLPKEPVLVAEIEKTIHAIETRQAAKPKAVEAKIRQRRK